MNEHFHFSKNIEEASDEDIRSQQEKVIAIEMPLIRTLDFLFDDGGIVTYEYGELTALCPMTGIQDLYTLRIQFIPDRKVPELKSLRYHLLDYRNIPILHEHLTNTIFRDFMKAVEPKHLRIELEAAVRGGFHTRVVKEGTPTHDRGK
jgi:7-cyano-7-deazaguanine reductase